jgi:exopolyphosphatase/guanosine-5'-triphosphate,3'-diphosphate pyrophosphatase
MGASSIRLVVAEVEPDGSLRVLEDISRGVLLGKDTFTHARLGGATIEATLKALEGFRRVMDGYRVADYRAVATSAVREAGNSDSFLDRVRLRTGLEVEVIEGTEENRLTYVAVREALGEHEALRRGTALLVAVGGGSADISCLRQGEPVHSGTFALGSIRMRQNLAAWRGSHEQLIRLIRRHIHNVVEDIRQEMPLGEVEHFIALGSDVQFAAARILGEEEAAAELPVVPREDFLRFCDQVTGYDVEQLIERYRLPQVDAETLGPALMAYRELLAETRAERILVPDASLRRGLLLDMVHSERRGIEDFRRQVLSSAQALGERYRYDAAHARNVAHLAVRIFDELRGEHGLGDRERLLLEVAALLHDVGIYVNLRGHHKHSQYILSVSEVFGLSREDLLLVSNIARYHRRALPQKSHLPYMGLDRDTRLTVRKLAAILRVANALDADHLQKVTGVRLVREEDGWCLEAEGAGDLTMERLASTSRADLFQDTFGRRLTFREAGGRP